MSRLQRRLGTAAAVAGLLFVLSMTLFPASEPSVAPITCVFCGERAGVDSILNVLLFLPLGVGLALAGFSFRRTIVLAFLLSLFVETMQLLFIYGRDASLGDLITNTIGGGAGALLGLNWRAIVFPRPQRALHLTLAWSGGMMLVWSCTAWALAPQWPHDLPWLGRWAPEIEYFDHFDGKVLAVTAAGEPLPPGYPVNQDRFESMIESQPSLDARVILGQPTSRAAPIATVTDEWSRSIVSLSQRGQALEFHVRMRTMRLRLRNPIVSLPGALVGNLGDTVDVGGALQDGRFVLVTRQGDHMRVRSLPVSASWGWSLVLPWDYALGDEAHFLTGLWIAGLLAVLCYWGAQAGLPGWAGSVATPAVLLILIPRLGGLPAPHWSEWLAVAVGCLVGSSAARSASKVVSSEFS